jgi:hypothetical protein
MPRSGLVACWFVTLLACALPANAASAELAPAVVVRDGIHTVLPPRPAVGFRKDSEVAATAEPDFATSLRIYSRRGGLAPAAISSGPIAATIRPNLAACARGWPMRGHDPANTGHTAASGPALQTQPLWSFRPDPNTFVWRPAVAPDATIYVTTVAFPVGGVDGRLYALRPDGSVKWQAQLTNSSGQNVWSSATPVLDDHGNIYIAWAHDLDFGGLTALSLDSNGAIRWRFEPNIDLAFASHQEPVLANGVLYAATDTSFFLDDPAHRASIFALDPATGGQIWRWISPNLDTFFSGPAVGRDGHLYHASASNALRGAAGYLYRVRPTGDLDWSIDIGDGVNAPPTLDAQNDIYLGDLTGVAFKHSPAGARLWRYDTSSGQIYVSPMLNGDRVTVGAASAGLHVLNARTGNLEAVFAPTKFPMSQVSDRSGNSFFYAQDGIGTVLAFGRGGRQWWTFSTGTDSSVNAVVIAGVGRLLVGDSATLTAYVAPPLGDLNCDGTVNLHDLGPLLLALVNGTRYASQYPHCHRLLADVNGDGAIDGSDLWAFLGQLR